MPNPRKTLREALPDPSIRTILSLGLNEPSVPVGFTPATYRTYLGFTPETKQYIDSLRKDIYGPYRFRMHKGPVVPKGMDQGLYERGQTKLYLQVKNAARRDRRLKELARISDAATHYANIITNNILYGNKR